MNDPTIGRVRTFATVFRDSNGALIKSMSAAYGMDGSFSETVAALAADILHVIGDEAKVEAVNEDWGAFDAKRAEALKQASMELQEAANLLRRDFPETASLFDAAAKKALEAAS